MGARGVGVRPGWIVLGLASASLLMGAVGAVDCSESRFRSVATRASTVTIEGYVDRYLGVTVCAYQQSVSGGALGYVLGCTSPNANEPTDPDSCGVVWYPYAITVTLNGNNDFWFRDRGPEYTRVLVSQNVTNGTFFTATDDFYDGPSDSSTCWRSMLRENASIQPLTYFNGAVPSDLDCSSATRSFAGCPFTCNLPNGCDASYANTSNEFWSSIYRTNTSGQDTSQTRFDHYGATSAAGTPAGNWGYAMENGICVGGSNPGVKCDADATCLGGGNCNNYYMVMRRNTYGVESLNVRRGENRRNTKLTAYVKMKYADINNREIGLVGRWFDEDNYFVFMVREYGGDYARLQRRAAGTYLTLATATPSLNLLSWTKLGFKIIDMGSYVNSTFVPNGNCYLAGYVGSSLVVSNSSTGCSQNPQGNYGVYSNYNSSAQFWDLDAYVCVPGSSLACVE